MAERWILTPNGGKPLVLPLTPQRGGCRVTAIRTPPPARRVQYANRSEGALPSSKEWENREVFLELQLARPTDQWRSETHDFGAPAPEAEGDGDPPGWSGNVRRVASDGNPITTMIADLESAIGECAASGGTLRRVLASGRSHTYDVLDIESPDGPLWDLVYYVAKTTTIQLRATCAPFIRTAEVLLGEGTKAAGQRLLTIGGLQVPGDVPAVARIEFADASVAQTSLLYAVDQPNSTSAAFGVQTSAAALLPVAGAGSTTQTGSVTAAPRLVPAAGTAVPDGQWRTVQYLRRFDGPPLPLTGQYRALLRVWRTGTDKPLVLRMRWSSGARESGLSQNASWSSTLEGWQLADLGTVTLNGSLDGVIERLTPNTTDLIIDALLLIPISGSYGRAAASTQIVSGVVTASDPGTGTPGNLTGSAARVGGTWIGDGEGADFVRGSAAATKANGNSRYAALAVGSADQELTALLRSGAGAQSDSANVGLVIGNAAGIAAHLGKNRTAAAGAWAVGATFSRGDLVGYFTGTTIVGGAQAQVKAAVNEPSTVTNWWPDQAERAFRISHSQGVCTVFMQNAGELTFSTGLPAAPTSGLMVAVVADTTQVSFRNFAAFGAEAPDRLLHPTKTATVGSTSSSKVTPAGYAAPFLPEGDRPHLPASARGGRSTRVVLGVSRDDLRSGADSVGGDAFTARVYATPRWLQIPADDAPPSALYPDTGAYPDTGIYPT